MNRRQQMKVILFTFLFIILAFNAFSLGKKEADNTSVYTPDNSVEPINAGNQLENSMENRMENTTTIRGKIQIYGSEPHTFVGIVAENGTEYAVFPPSKEEELRMLQGYLIEFTVVLSDEPQGFGSMFLRGGTVTPIEWKILP